MTPEERRLHGTYAAAWTKRHHQPRWVRRFISGSGGGLAVLERARQMLMMYEDGASYAEIGLRFGLSASTVGSALKCERKRRREAQR